MGISRGFCAIDSTSFKVNFNAEVDSATVFPKSFKVTQKDNGNQLFVKSVEVAEDKKSATVTLYDAMTDAKVYAVATSAIKDAAGVEMTADNDEFTYTKAVPASIEFASTVVPEGSNIELAKYVKVQDANGTEIKSGFDLAFDASVTVTDGKITTSGLKTVVVNAKVKGTELATGNKILTVEARTAKEVTELKLAKGTTDVVTLYQDGKAYDKDGAPISSGTLNLEAKFKDQFGDEITTAVEGTAYTYESLTPEILTVTKGGDVTPVASGTAMVRVKYGTVTKTIQVEIKATATLDAITASAPSVTVAKGQKSTFKVNLKDQYGNAFTGPVSVSSEATGTATATVSDSGTGKSEYTVTVTGVADGATNVVVKNGTKEIKVPVTVVAGGNVASYEIKVLDDGKIDKSASESPANDDAQIKVYALDASGNIVADVTNDVTVAGEVTDTNGVILSVTKRTINGEQVWVAENDGSTKVGTEALTVKLGSVTLGTVNVEVIDSSVVATTVTKKADLVKATDFDTLADVLSNIVIKDQAGTEMKDDSTTSGTDEKLVALTSVLDKVYSSDASVIKPVADGSSLAELLVQGEGSTSLTFTFDADSGIAPIAFTVNVDYKDLVEVLPEANVVAHTVADQDDAEVTGTYEDGVFTFSHDFAKLTEEQGGAPSVAKWVGAYIEGPTGAASVATLTVDGTDPRDFEDVAFETETGFEDGFFYFFPAQEGGNTNNLTIAWADADGNIIKVEKLQVKYVNTPTV